MLRRAMRMATVICGILLAGVIATSQRYSLKAGGAPAEIATYPMGVDIYWGARSSYEWHVGMIPVVVEGGTWFDYFYIPGFERAGATRVGYSVPWWLILSSWGILTAVVWRLTRRRKMMAAFPVEAAGPK